MALDATLKKQLLDAREKIIAQLNETQFPDMGSDLALRHGAVYDYAYVELQQELREIDELLGIKECDQDGGASSATTPAESPLPTFLTRGRQPKLSKFLAPLALLVFLLTLVLVLVLSFIST